MGLFTKIWDHSLDGDRKEARSFIRVAVVTIFVFLTMFIAIKRDGIFRWAAAGIKVKKQEQEIEFLQKDIIRLKEKIKALETNKDTLEKYARERFFFSKPGEDVYIIEPSSSSQLP